MSAMFDDGKTNDPFKCCAECGAPYADRTGGTTPCTETRCEMFRESVAGDLHLWRVGEITAEVALNAIGQAVARS